MKQQIENWERESNAFYEWFKSLGGNIANDEQMTEAFIRIEAKNVSDNKLYKLLENKEPVFNQMPTTYFGTKVNSNIDCDYCGRLNSDTMCKNHPSFCRKH